LVLNSKKRFYILFVSRDADGNLNKVPIPVHYATLFVTAAIVGIFTITGLAGSYTRMLAKTARFNQLRQDHESLQKDYATLEKQARQKDVQAASLGSLATEVSALYGITANKIGSFRSSSKTSPVVVAATTAPLKDSDSANSSFNSDAYYKSIDSFYALRSSAMSTDSNRALAGAPDIAHMVNPLLPAGLLSAETPTLWPVTGPITSSFGARDNPFNGDDDAGEFHPGIDISGPQGTPIHATADGIVTTADQVNGYGRLVVIDHGHGLETRYGHMSGYAVSAGQSVTKGQVIGYIGHSGRATGNHVHYEVRIHNLPVNPHKYLRTTLAELAASPAPASE
jgi:murein DD-endopeptidase MepM/ murein hydrolase activator NlpD